MDKICYKNGYKYQLCADYEILVEGITLSREYSSEFLRIQPDLLPGNVCLRIKAGYAWDGPSGPTIDTKTFMRGSLVHDALYQLMRERVLNKNLNRKVADKILYALCRQDGMSWFRAKYVYWGVRFGANMAAIKEEGVQTAP